MELNASDEHHRPVVFGLGETSEHAHSPQSRPGLGGVWLGQAAALVGDMARLCTSLHALWLNTGVRSLTRSGFDATSDERTLCALGVGLTLASGFGLCLSNWQEARNLPNRYSPQACTHIGCGNSSLDSRHIIHQQHTDLLCLLCQFRSSWCTPTGVCSASIHNRWLPCLREGGPQQGTRQESRWLIAPLPCDRLRSAASLSPEGVDCLHPMSPPTTTTLPSCLPFIGACQVRPGLGFRLRCVQSVSVTW